MGTYRGSVLRQTWWQGGRADSGCTLPASSLLFSQFLAARSTGSLLSPSPGAQHLEGTAGRGWRDQDSGVFRVRELVIGGAHSQSYCLHPLTQWWYTQAHQQANLRATWGTRLKNPFYQIQKHPQTFRELLNPSAVKNTELVSTMLPLWVVSCFPVPLEMQWWVATQKQLGSLYPCP